MERFNVVRVDDIEDVVNAYYVNNSLKLKETKAIHTYLVYRFTKYLVFLSFNLILMKYLKVLKYFC